MSGNYIVVFKKDVSQEEIDKYAEEVNANGGAVKHKYSGATLKGFSAQIPDSFLSQLQSLQGGIINYIDRARPGGSHSVDGPIKDGPPYTTDVLDVFMQCNISVVIISNTWDCINKKELEESTNHNYLSRYSRLANESDLSCCLHSLLLDRYNVFSIRPFAVYTLFPGVVLITIQLWTIGIAVQYLVQGVYSTPIPRYIRWRRKPDPRQFEQLQANRATTTTPILDILNLKMFARVYNTIIYLVFSLSLLAAAMPNNPPPVTTTITVTAPAPTVTTVSQCNTGSIQCCQQVESASSAAGSLLLGLLGIVLTDLDVLLGLDCSPISIIGVGSGSACSANPVCCENNSLGGLISIGCVPITL
ncbi:hypothetical protein NM688_g6881 [Phlebia brevispora]|uniref:Uncharacterized protein n=1 Tax=Phlebia brevispora TaxID=194682 RepID=A0ACC1SBE2_9APHY|nr:hypothetical protein NM688_g6881 [Phlebia brevispora]